MYNSKNNCVNDLYLILFIGDWVELLGDAKSFLKTSQWLEADYSEFLYRYNC